MELISIILLAITLWFLVYFLISIVTDEPVENNVCTIDNCISIIKDLPEDLRTKSITEDLFKLLISYKDINDYRTDLNFVSEFDRLTNSSDFKMLFIERSYIDNYPFIEQLDSLKSELDTYFTLREEHLYNV
jgi:hypothetical protein